MVVEATCPLVYLVTEPRTAICPVSRHPESTSRSTALPRPGVPLGRPAHLADALGDGRRRHRTGRQRRCLLLGGGAATPTWPPPPVDDAAGDGHRRGGERPHRPTSRPSGAPRDAPGEPLRPSRREGPGQGRPALRRRRHHRRRPDQDRGPLGRGPARPSPRRCSPSSASARTSSAASTRCGPRVRLRVAPTTRPPPPTASRRRCPARRCLRPAPTGPPTRSPRSGGASATSRTATARRAAPGAQPVQRLLLSFALAHVSTSARSHVGLVIHSTSRASSSCASVSSPRST